MIESMKKIICLLALTCLLFGLWSCGDDEIDPYVPNVDVKLRESSIAQDAEVYAEMTTVLTLSYNVNVTVSPSANITLNGQKVEARSASTSAMNVEIPLRLEPATSYTLNVPAGAIVAKNNAKNKCEAYTLRFSTKAADPEEAWDESQKARLMARALGWGWNLGNHFDTGANSDANGNPIDFQKPKWGYWDGAKPTEQLYRNLAAMGVGSVRIPVTWGVYQKDDGEYTIDESYMAEVERNVLWALNAGLYVILNTHHD